MKKSYIIIAVVIAIMIIAMGIYAVVNNNKKDEEKRKNTNEESNSISGNIEKIKLKIHKQIMKVGKIRCIVLENTTLK